MVGDHQRLGEAALGQLTGDGLDPPARSTPSGSGSCGSPWEGILTSRRCTAVELRTPAAHDAAGVERKVRDSNSGKTCTLGHTEAVELEHVRLSGALGVVQNLGVLLDDYCDLERKFERPADSH